MRVDRHAAADVVRLAQREQVVDRVGPDALDEPPDPGVAPFGLVREHVVPDEVDDPADRRPRHVEAVEELLRHVRADRLVTSERPFVDRRRLAEVVEQRGEPDHGPARRRRVDRAERVVEEVLALDLVLGHATLRVELGQDDGQEPGLGHAGAARSRAGPRPAASRAPPRCARRRRGRPARAFARIAARVAGSIAKSSTAASRTARTIRRASSRNRAAGSPTARRTRASTSATPSNGSTIAGVGALPAAPFPAGAGAPRDGVDREVAAGEVELDVVPELDPVRAPEVGVVVVGPEGRDLVDRVALADRDGPELVLVDRAGEDGEEPVRSRVGREIPVLGRPAEERVPDRAADDVRRVAVRPQPLHERADGRRGVDRDHALRVQVGDAPVRLSCGRGTGTFARPRCGRPRDTA